MGCLTMLNVISLGAGVQSSTMALMAAEGEITPMPEAAIFADTGWEPAEVYTHLDWLEKQLPFPVYRVGNGDIRADILARAKLHTREETRALEGEKASLPLFMGGGGMLNRQCTRSYKIEPVTKKTKELLGIKPRQRTPKEPVVNTWIGISMDECSRMKDSQDKWRNNHYPLIGKRMSRTDCKEWFAKHYPDNHLPRSACIGCPYHSDVEWRDMKLNDPVSFQDAVDFDHALREHGNFSILKEKAYLHKSAKPLDEIDFRSLEDMGQINMFENECEGMCGV